MPSNVENNSMVPEVAFFREMVSNNDRNQMQSKLRTTSDTNKLLSKINVQNLQQ